MATKKYLDYAGLKRVLAKLLPGARKIWHGTLAEWEALSATEKAKYDQAEVIDEYTGVPVVVDKVESGNLNPVTSNAVYGLIKQAKFTATTNSNGGVALPSEYANKNILSAKRVDPGQDNIVLILGNTYLKVLDQSKLDGSTFVPPGVTNTSMTIRITYIDVTV